METGGIEIILGRKKNSKGQIGISLSEAEVLIDNGAEIKELNKVRGTCYSHVFSYEGGEFFAVTGNDVNYVEAYRCEGKHFIIKSMRDGY